MKSVRDVTYELFHTFPEIKPIQDENNISETIVRQEDRLTLCQPHCEETELSSALNSQHTRGNKTYYLHLFEVCSHPHTHTILHVWTWIFFCNGVIQFLKATNVFKTFNLMR